MFILVDGVVGYMYIIFCCSFCVDFIFNIQENGTRRWFDLFSVGFDSEPPARWDSGRVHRFIYVWVDVCFRLFALSLSGWHFISVLFCLFVCYLEEPGDKITHRSHCTTRTTTQKQSAIKLSRIRIDRRKCVCVCFVCICFSWFRVLCVCVYICDLLRHSRGTQQMSSCSKDRQAIYMWG